MAAAVAALAPPTDFELDSVSYAGSEEQPLGVPLCQGHEQNYHPVPHPELTQLASQRRFGLVNRDTQQL